jgi:hypothetical protein
MSLGVNNMNEIPEDVWRTIINSLDAPDLPEVSEKPENVKVDKDSKSDKDKTFFVQKITTEIYVYTDFESQQYGEISFQDVVILGEMPGDKMLRLFRRKRRQKEG